MSDELAEINGVKPNVAFEDGEEKEVGSSSSKSVYKVKRTADHFHCTCPAWRNQKGQPVNARTCKHLKALLGEEYEAARVELKNPGSGAAAKPTAKGKAPAASKAKPKVPPKRKKGDNEEDDEEDEAPPLKRGRSTTTTAAASAKPTSKSTRASTKVKDEDEVPAKRGSKVAAKPPSKTTRASKVKDEEIDENDNERPPAKRGGAPGKPASKAAMANAKKEEKDEDDDAMDVDADDPPKTRSSDQDDELAEINGVRPKVLLEDGEQCDVKSATSKSTYKVKRSFDHYHCSCPAWRNQSALVNARTCKHIQSLLGEAYEAARLKSKNSANANAKTKPSSKASIKPPSKAATKPSSATKQAPSSKRKQPDDEDGEGAAKKTLKAPASKGKDKIVGKEEPIEEEEGGRDEDGDPEGGDDAPPEDEDGAGDADGADELAVIAGIKPKVYLKDGDETEVKSSSSNSMYKVKRTWDHYYCACPAWRNQRGPVNARTCKHLQALLGAAYEAARLKLKDPDGHHAQIKGKGKAKPKSKGKSKKKGTGDEEEGEEEGEDGDEDEDGEGAAKKFPDLLLANKWDLDTGIDPTGWWISEKLDGVRTFFDGKQFYSRLGNPFMPPKWFIEALPKDVTLDGELFGGRQQFQSTVSIVKTMNSPHWKGISFQVFDIPSRATDPFEQRLATLEALFGAGATHACAHVSVVKHEAAKNREHVLEKLKEVEGLGGEGVMLREPKSQYQASRSSTLLKVKTFYDAEAVVTGYVPGKGRNVGVTGALKCKMASGKTFNVGTGLNDKQRKNPPKVGSIVVYRFQELTRDRVPRFPSYVGEAADKTEPKDAHIPAARVPGAKPVDA